MFGGRCQIVTEDNPQVLPSILRTFSEKTFSFWLLLEWKVWIERCGEGCLEKLP